MRGVGVRVGKVDDVPGAGLLHPVALLALGLLIVNDRLLKHSHPGWLTGKLSDVSGLCFFPLLLLAMVEWCRFAAGVRRWHTPRWGAPAAALTTGLMFSLINLSPVAGGAYVRALRALWRLLGQHGMAASVAHWVDPGDLIALPALWVPVWIARRCSAARYRAASPSTPSIPSMRAVSMR